MLFDSIHYVIFFSLVCLAYFRLHTRSAQIMLLLSSYFFYMSWDPRFGLLLFATTALDYLVALRMERVDSRERRAWLCLSLAYNLGALALFKYLGFFAVCWQLLQGEGSGPASTAGYLLPVGISFYTFQAISYIIDVYRGTRPAERSFLQFALYVSFFPQLVAGPIERSTTLLPQLAHTHCFDEKRISEGLRRILVGLFKKIVIADNLGAIVAPAFADPLGNSASALLVAAYCFPLQMYFDFSAYTDIAIGSARVLGYDLIENFQKPFLSRSIPEFWRRWHISLMSWFRDYVYFPLGGNRVGRLRFAANILAVYALAGLWHGANFTFLAWGLINGLLVLINPGLEKALGALCGTRRRLQTFVSIALTFQFIALSAVFFRASSLTLAALYLQRLFGPYDIASLREYFQSIEQANLFVLPPVISIALGLTVFLPVRRGAELLEALPLLPRWASYVLIALAIGNLGMFAKIPFQYFQF